MAEAAKGVGRPKVGGPFQLTDHEGKLFSDTDLKGKYSLVSCNYIALSWLPALRQLGDKLGADTGAILMPDLGLFWLLALSGYLP